MVLVNTLTIEAINTALIALQRGKDIVVGGEKGTTINNITISNSGSGGSSGSSLDFSPQVDALDKRIGLLEKAEELLRIENEKQSERIAVLEGLGIEDVQFDDTSRTLSIELVNGETFETDITSETLSMRLEGNDLVIKFGESEQRLPLPVGTQADWEQTDPNAPDYIKNKIPIWIEDGPASDNMAPVDSVTSGEMRPVTSNAVANAGFLTSADITDQVTVDNMQSVSSNAVAQKIKNVLSNYELKYKRVTGTTNVYGTLYSQNSNLVGNECIVFANCISHSDYMYLVGYGNYGTWIKVARYDYVDIANTTVTLEVLYFEKIV